MNRVTDKTVLKRQAIERRIARRVIRDAVAGGYTLDVFDGEETVLRNSTKEREILKAMFSVDEERLIFRKDGARVGWVFFVYGNSGWDVICDYTDKPEVEEILKGANELADKLDS